MNTIKLEVENIKCNGCATQIKDKISNAFNVSAVQIDLEKGAIEISGENLENNNKAIEDLLKKMGYPKKGESSGLDVAKSYVSCMIGRTKN